MAVIHELTVRADGRVEGYEELYIRGGDYYSHTLRFTFLNGIPGASVRMKLQPKGKAAVFYDAEDGADNFVSFTPPVWETGDVWIQLEATDELTDAVWNSARFMLIVQESIYGAAAAPKLMDTSGATAAPENLQLGKTAYADGKKITGTMPTQEGGTVSVDAANKRIVEGPCLVMSDIFVQVAGAVPENIKKGAVIAGITGTYQGEDGPYDSLEDWPGLEKYEKKDITVVSEERIWIDRGTVKEDVRGQFSDFPEDAVEILLAELTIKAPPKYTKRGALTERTRFLAENGKTEWGESYRALFFNGFYGNLGVYRYEVSEYGILLWNRFKETFTIDVTIYYRSQQ